MAHVSTAEADSARKQLLMVLESFSRLQWITLRRDLNLSCVSRADYVSSLRDTEVEACASQVAAWRDSNAHITSADEPEVVFSKDYVPTSILERVFATNEPACHTVFSFLFQHEAAPFRACSTGCREYVAAFAWPHDRSTVEHLGRWRACFPRALGVDLMKWKFGPGDEKYLAGLKRISVYECEGLTEASFSLCSELEWLSPCDDSGSYLSQALTYTPNLEVLDCCLYDERLLWGVRNLNKLRELEVHSRDGVRIRTRQLAYIPPSVRKLVLEDNITVKDASLSVLRHVRELYIGEYQPELTGAFLKELPRLQVLGLWQTSAQLYIAAVNHFFNNKNALAALSEADLVNDSANDDEFTRFGELGGNELVHNAIKHHRGDLATVLSLWKPTECCDVAYLLEALCIHLGVTPPRKDEDVPAPASLLMPLIWGSLQRRVKWGELECNAMKAIIRSWRHEELFNNGQAASIILRQLQYLLPWDVSPFLSSIEPVCENADVQEEVGSRAGLTAIVNIMRNPFAKFKDYDTPATTILTHVVTTPQRKEILWELGGVDILMDRGKYAEAGALFPTHSHAAVLKFARTRSAAMREFMPAYAESFEQFNHCIALLDMADKAVEAELQLTQTHETSH
jgi:hypothetical protein